jgi:DeoR/GlpR family transcriptional regulator of sugar metabolism
LQNQGNIGVSELASRFGVSPMTIRRDLEYLEARQLASRTHGGALLAGDMASEWPHRFKTHAHSVEKQRLAVVATSVVRPGSTIILDAGSTTLEIGRRLKEIKPLTVVTNDIIIARELADEDGITVICTGGEVRRDVYSLDGPFTEWLLQQMHVDLAFIGCDGFDQSSGAMTKTQTKITCIGYLTHPFEKWIAFCCKCTRSDLFTPEEMQFKQRKKLRTSFPVSANNDKEARH